MISSLRNSPVLVGSPCRVTKWVTSSPCKGRSPDSPLTTRIYELEQKSVEKFHRILRESVRSFRGGIGSGFMQFWPARQASLPETEITDNLTIEELVRRYLEYKKPDITDSSWKQYCYALRLLGKIFPGQLITGFGKSHILTLRAKICERSARATQETLRGYFILLFHWAAEMGYLQARFCYDFEVLWKHRHLEDADLRRERIHYTIEEENLLCNAAPKPIAKFIHIAIALGFRRSTIYAIRFDWLSQFDNPTCPYILEVPGNFQKNKRHLFYPISQRVMGFIGPLESRGPLLSGLPHPRKLGGLLKDIAELVGLSRAISPHQFRRTWCYRAHMAGITRDQAQDLQGWSSSNVMLNHYWPHQSIEEKIAIVKQMGL
jgi:integrase